MCIFDCCRRSTNRRFWLEFGRYQIYDCEKCKKQKKLENLQFCGRFSILYENLLEFRQHLQTQLIKLEGISNFIQCQKCKQKYFLDKKDNHLFVSKFTCIHQKENLIKQCIYCRQLTKKQKYQKCKKCQLSLLFFDTRRKVECPCCNIICCEICKEELQLFQQQFCNCKIIRLSKMVIFYQLLVFAIILLIILALIGSSYLENSEYYQSIVCTIGDGYSNINCTLEQLYKDTFKQFTLFIGLILVMSLMTALIESITLLLKTQNKLQRAKSVRLR